MKDTHIIELLDSMPLVEIDADQRSLMRTHADGCDSCRSALAAAELVSLTLQVRAATTVEPSPFFQTRVLAALREQQANTSVPALLRLWRSAGKLVASMAVTTAALAALSFLVVPASSPVDQTATMSSQAEAVLFDQGNEDLSYEQVLSTIYSVEDEAK
jgi:hypothetical protein